MKVSYKLLVPALLAGFILTGCGEKDVATPVDEMTEAAGEMVESAGEMAEDATEAATEATSSEPGGYVPTADELIPGETRP